MASPDTRRQTAKGGTAPKRDIWMRVPPDLEDMSVNEAADAFYASEEFYVERALRISIDNYENFLKNYDKLGRTILTPEEIGEIFLNLSNIYDFHRSFLTALQKLRFLGFDLLFENLGKLMIQFIPFFKLYTTYVKGYRKSLKTLELLSKKKKPFHQFLELHEMCSVTPLVTLLASPVTRLPQYLAFLGAIHRGMWDKESEAARSIENAVAKILGVTEEISNNLRDEVRRRLVVTIQEKTFKGSILVVSPHRYVIKHGDLKIVYKKSAFHARFKIQLFVLFNDMILFGRQGKARHVLQLEGMTCEDAPDGEDYKNAFQLRGNLKDKDYILSSKTAEEKQAWLAAIKEQISLVKSGAAGIDYFPGSPEDFEAVIFKKITVDKVKPVAGRQATKSKAGPGLTRSQSMGNVESDADAARKQLVMAQANADMTAERDQLALQQASMAMDYNAYNNGMAMGMGMGYGAIGQSDWVKRFTDDGTPYWANPVTQESSWDPPPGWMEPEAMMPPAMTNWTEVWDEQSGRSYFVNLVTHETQWDMPAELLQAHAMAQGHDPYQLQMMQMQQQQQLQYQQELEQQQQYHQQLQEQQQHMHMATSTAISQEVELPPPPADEPDDLPPPLPPAEAEPDLPPPVVPEAHPPVAHPPPAPVQAAPVQPAAPAAAAPPAAAHPAAPPAAAAPAAAPAAPAKPAVAGGPPPAPPKKPARSAHFSAENHASAPAAAAVAPPAAPVAPPAAPVAPPAPPAAPPVLHDMPAAAHPAPMAPAPPVAPPPPAALPPSAPPMAPPPPAGPAAPRGPPPPPGPPPAPTLSLMDAIKGGTPLRAAGPPPPVSPTTASGAGSLLDAIKAGTKLRKAEDLPKPAPVAATGLMATLGGALDRYRQFVVADEDDDDVKDGDDWD